MPQEVVLSSGRRLMAWRVDKGEWNVFEKSEPLGRITRDKNGHYKPSTGDLRYFRSLEDAAEHLAEKGDPDFPSPTDKGGEGR